MHRSHIVKMSTDQRPLAYRNDLHLAQDPPNWLRSSSASLRESTALHFKHYSLYLTQLTTTKDYITEPLLYRLCYYIVIARFPIYRQMKKLQIAFTQGFVTFIG